MKIVYSHFYENTHARANGQNTVYVDNRSALSRKDERQSRVEKARENERKIRENEDKMIEELRKRIEDVQVSGMDKRLKDLKISALSDQIQGILEGRAQREQEAAQRQIEEQQAEMEKKQKEREEQQQSNGEEEDPEDALRREDIQGMVKLSVSHESMRALKHTRASMAAEAERLQQDIDNTYGFQQIGLDTTVRVKAGYDTPNDFRNRHLTKLRRGIASIDTAVTSRTIRMSNDVSRWVERKQDIIEKAEQNQKPPETDVEKQTETELETEISKGEVPTEDSQTA